MREAGAEKETIHMKNEEASDKALFGYTMR